MPRVRLLGSQYLLGAKRVPRDLCGQRLEHVERDLEAVDFLGIDGEVDVGARRLVGELPHAGDEFAHDAVALQRLVARVQRAQLDRDPVVRLDRAVGPRARGDRLDRVAIAREIALRVAARWPDAAAGKRKPSQR